MSFGQLENRGTFANNIFPGIVLMVAAVTVGAIFLIQNIDSDSGLPYPFLLPWLLGLALVLAIPPLILFYQGKFRLDNPLIFATFSYFYPAFVFGGIGLAVGLSQPYFLAFVQDARETLPYTVMVVILGYAGLAIGYFLPVGRKLGEMVSHYLPNANYEMSSFRIPGAILMGLGIINSALSLVLGLFGFQRGGEIGTYDGILFLTTLFWMQGSFLLWFVIFRTRKIDFNAWLVIGLLVLTAASKALFAGNRGSLVQIFIFVTLAYIMAGREFKLKQAAWSGIFLTIALVLGTIYGTTFRDVKGSEDKVGAGEYAESVLNTIDKLGTSDNTATLNVGLYTLAERIDTLSSLAVVVSNYEQLEPYEESYDLNNNIVKDLTTFFIPRIIWPDKPVASEARKYSELYFNFGENSFAITPMGDLLRNFGLIGVPLGMLILGMILRFVYRALVEDQPMSLWRSTVFFMLVTAVSYESFYGAIIPFMVKVGATSLTGMFVVTLIAKRISRGRLNPEF